MRKNVTEREIRWCLRVNPTVEIDVLNPFQLKGMNHIELWKMPNQIIVQVTKNNKTELYVEQETIDEFINCWTKFSDGYVRY